MDAGFLAQLNGHLPQQRGYVGMQGGRDELAAAAAAMTDRRDMGGAGMSEHGLNDVDLELMLSGSQRSIK
eukprot:4677751-Pyramimonas_sp.AAC.1